MNEIKSAIKPFSEEKAKEIINSFLNISNESEGEEEDNDELSFCEIKDKLYSKSIFEFGKYKDSKIENSIPYTLFCDNPHIGIIFGKNKYVLFDNEHIEARTTIDEFEDLLNYVFSGLGSSLILKLECC